MLKALFLDMDETLCDTQGANQKARTIMAECLDSLLDRRGNSEKFADQYLTGIYREWSKAQLDRYAPIISLDGEAAFRHQLILDLFVEHGVQNIDPDTAQQLQEDFDFNRLEAFTFYPGIKAFLTEAGKHFTLVVITNGPEYSQIPKLDKINMAARVDHIIIGGQEPEQKPAVSIFQKAMKLAKCEAHEVIHVGDSLTSDIAGAFNSGITSLWIQHQQPLDAEIGIKPDYSVAHPSEIPALIKKLHPY